MKKNILLVSSILLSLASCSSSKVPETFVSTFDGSNYIYSNSGKIRVVDQPFATPFNTSISGTLYQIDGQYSKEQIEDIQEEFSYLFQYYHALTDRHYSYVKLENLMSEDIVNVKTINESYGKGVYVKVDQYLFDLLKMSYDFTINSDGKFNMFLGSINDIYENKLASVYDEKKDIYSDVFTYATDRMFSSFSDYKEEQISSLASSIPHNSDELKDILQFDDINCAVKFNRYKGDNDIPLVISLGGNGKGFATDMVAKVLQEEYPDISLLINSGFSSIKAIGNRPDNRAWKIRYNNPIYHESLKERSEDYNPSEVIVTNPGSFNLSTSGHYNQYFYQYEDGSFNRRMHIIDATTGFSKDTFDQISVYLDRASLADMYTTAMMNTDSYLEAIDLFDKLNEIYSIKDAGYILCYKAEKGDKDKQFDYSLDDFDVLSDYNLPILKLKDGSRYEGDYKDIKREQIEDVISKFEPNFDEVYMVSDSLYHKTSYMKDEVENKNILAKIIKG